MVWVFTILLLLLYLPVEPHEVLKEVVNSKFFVRKEFGFNTLRELHVPVFGRTYILDLAVKKLPVHNNCLIRKKNGINTTEIKASDLNVFSYAGKVVGIKGSHVNLMDSERQYRGTINLLNQSIFFHPSKDSDANEGDITFYLQNNPVMGIEPEPKRRTVRDSPWRNPLKENLGKSQNMSYGEPIKKNRCQVHIVVDYEFFKFKGGTKNVYSFIVSMVDKVNEIFERTDFDFETTDTELLKERGRHVGLGIQVLSVDIFEKEGINNTDFLNSTAHSDGHDIDVLKNNFRKNYRCPEVCICHLITGKPIKDDRFGVADLASPENDEGICATQNTVLSRGRLENEDINDLKMFLLAAHEYGHVFGSNHDSASIMEMVQVDGSWRTHQFFSNESKRNISIILNEVTDCLKERSNSICGNSFVETDEQCDRGETNDSCCTSDCKLQSDAKCSPSSGPCCENNCLFRNNTHKCSNRTDELCIDEAFCSGYSQSCPPGLPLSDVPCYGNGTCMNGTCISYCVFNGNEDCFCEGNEACKRCCRGKDGLCVPQKDMHIPNRGYCGKKSICDEQKCIPQDREGWSLLLEEAGLGGITLVLILFTLAFMSCVYCVCRYDAQLS